MHLDSGAFLAIFALFFLIYDAAPRRVKRLLLVLGSIAFYATLAVRYVPLFLALGVFTFLLATRLHRATSETRRDHLLYLGVAGNVATLAFFKCAAPSGFKSLADVVPPLGMSFYTLQAVSFVVDVHRRLYEPPESLLSFLASFTLFPHLLAGPIVRSSFLVPQIEKVEHVAWTSAKRAIFLFTVGLVKKSIADALAPTADAAFDATRTISPLEAWSGLLAYAGQLYGDFSGYTDMATALALLLGLELPPNFDLPYLATSPADFWRRWHISLSTWLRDYVYLPLGVHLRRRRYTNVMLTWIVAGIWHGASWLFLLYGFYHGVLLALTDWLGRRFGRVDEVRGPRRVAQNAVTLYLVLMGYVLFRARSVGAALHFLAELHVPHAPSVVTQSALSTMAVSVGATVFCHLLEASATRGRAAIERSWLTWPAIVLAVTAIALFRGAAQPFIYFAF
jgi:D-alanyl-lipoteichoic acid acyltransferase DltB (MBOAT superfamily)